MTKVLTSFVALRLYEDGLLAFDDPVSDYIPSFGRTWNIAVDSEDGPDRIDYCSFLSGKTATYDYRLIPAREPIRIKHLMSETSASSMTSSPNMRSCSEEAYLAEQMGLLNPVVPADGWITFPTGPGWGAEWDWERFKKSTVDVWE